MNQTKSRRHPALNRENRVLYVEDIMEILGIGQTKAYQIIRRLNEEIEAAGYFKPIGGRVSEAYFRERFYLGEARIAAPTPERRAAHGTNRIRATTAKT